MILLENRYIKAQFTEQGAELLELRNTTNGIDYLWSGDPTYWGKHSPVLFPIVGALKNGTYQYQEKTYHLPRHGFARNMKFNLLQLSAVEILFTLRDSPETMAVYPFAFNLGIRYQLDDRTLKCTYEIDNPGSLPMYFSIGGHPAFAVPLNPNQDYTDYYLEFSEDTALYYHQVVGDLVADKTEKLALDNRKLYLRHELFYQDAMVLKSLKSNRVSIKNRHDSSALLFTFDGFPYFGIWAAKDAPFICLEPWCGIADGENHNQQLTDKDGIISLGAGQKWKRNWQAEIV